MVDVPEADVPVADAPTADAPAAASPTAEARSAEAPAADARGSDANGSDASGPGSPGSALGDLRRRAVEARARLRPERVAVPAPRSPGGVTLPAVLRSDPDAPSADLVAAADALVEGLAVLERTPDDPAHRALARIAELTRAGVPGQGWSAAEGLAVEALEETAALAGRLARSGAALLERLDAEDRPSPAVVVDALATSLRVIGMVAELEVFARAR